MEGRFVGLFRSMDGTLRMGRGGSSSRWGQGPWQVNTSWGNGTFDIQLKPVPGMKPWQI